MRILIVTPAPRGSTKGNRITAERWAQHLHELQHTVQVSDGIVSGDFDCLIALHATRSADVIADFQAEAPNAATILCLTGTDLHIDLAGLRGDDARQRALISINRSSRLVLLEPEGVALLPSNAEKKACVILQSATPVAEPILQRSDSFDVCVLGHLRDEKDPFLTANASLQLPRASRVSIFHIGAALNDQMRELALAQTEANPRYQWLGSLPRAEAQQRLASSQLMVLSSKVEGAPSVISEAIVNGVPILATRITATIGLLGNDYPGLFPVRDSSSLCKLMTKAESDVQFLSRIQQAVVELAPRFAPEHERTSLKKLMDSLSCLYPQR